MKRNSLLAVCLLNVFEGRGRGNTENVIEGSGRIRLMSRNFIPDSKDLTIWEREESAIRKYARRAVEGIFKNSTLQKNNIVRQTGEASSTNLPSLLQAAVRGARRDSSPTEKNAIFIAADNGALPDHV